MPSLKQTIPVLRQSIGQMIVRAVLPENRAFESIAGTGFFVADQRYVATAAHVIRKTEEELRQQGGENIHFAINLPMKELHLSGVQGLMGFFASDIEIVDIDEKHDLALLRTPEPIGPKGSYPVIQVEGKEFNVLQVNDGRFYAGSPEVGEEIAVAGFPLAIPYLIVQKGIVSAIPIFPVQGAGEEREEIVIDAAVNPGNSGGPVFMATNGLIIGVCRAQHLAPVVGTAAAGLSQNAGLSLITPAKFLLGLMKKHGVNPHIR